MAASALPPPPQTALTDFDRWMTSLYPIVQYGIGLLPSNNLSDLASAATARTNLGLGALATLGTSPTLVAPNIGTATGTSLAVTGALTSSGTAGIGYATGAGGAVTQSTTKTTSVTINKMCGQVTTSNSALAAGAKAAFAVNNNLIGINDGAAVWISSGGTSNAYRVNVCGVAIGSFTVVIENITGGSLSESPVVGFAVIKAVAS